MTVGSLERVFAELGIRTNLQTWWEGAELDRLLAGRHSAMHDAIARMFESLPEWTIAPEVSFAIYRRARHHRHPGVARGEPNAPGDRAQDRARRRPGDGRDARSEASACRAGCRRAWLEARRGIGLARHRRQSDQPASGRGASGDAARGLPGRRPNDRPLAAVTLRSDRGALVPAFHSWHECQSRVRPGPTRQWSEAERGPSAIGRHPAHEASVGRSPRAPTPPSTRAASAWRPSWPAPPLRNHLASTWRRASPGDALALTWRVQGGVGPGPATRSAERGERRTPRRTRQRGDGCPSPRCLISRSPPVQGRPERALTAARRAWFPARATWPPS